MEQMLKFFVCCMDIADVDDCMFVEDSGEEGYERMLQGIGLLRVETGQRW